MDGGDLKLHLGAATGLPFLTKRNSIPLYKNGDTRKRPESIRKARVDVFDLSDPTQFAVYQKLWEAAGYGLVTVAEEDKKWIESKENWKVFIRWCLNGQMDSGELRDTRLDSITSLYSDISKENDHVE